MGSVARVVLAHSVLTWLVLAPGVGVLAQQDPGHREVDFDIPPQPLGPAIASFIRATEIEIVIDAALVQGKRTPGVLGGFTLDDALATLLDGTGLDYRFTTAKTVTIMPAGADTAPASATGACKWLSDTDASVVVGQKATPATADACTFAGGTLQLQIGPVVEQPDRATLGQRFDDMLSTAKGTVEPGIGERAFTARTASGFRVVFVKGSTLVSVQVTGQGAETDEVARRMKEAAAKIAGGL
jgi:hypothetical protein